MTDRAPSVSQEFGNRLPPQDTDAEESILSAILHDNNTLLDIVEILSPEDFYRSSHQKIYSAITGLFTRNEPIDLVTLANILKQRKHLEEVGGGTYLSQLFDVPLAISPAHHAKIVRDKACLRRLITKTSEISRKCFEDQGEVDQVIDFAENAIFAISGDKSKQSIHPIGEIISKNIDELEERKGSNTLLTGVPTGFTPLDTLTSGFQGSDLIIIAARPAMGKTAFALNIARNAAVDSGVPTAVFSLEMSKEQLSMRMLCAEARIDSAKIRGGFFGNDDWMRITEAAGVLSEAPLYIDDSPDISAMEIRAKARRMKMDRGLGLVIIDYLQLMRGRMDAERRDLEISEISRSLKILAKELSIPVVALSQLNRKLEERADKRPMLSDLRESGALEQDADVVAFIYRDEVYNKEENNPNRNKAEIIIAKQRSGPVGTAHLAFLGSYTRFENLAPDAYYSMG